MKKYVKNIPICHYKTVENCYANVSFIPLRNVKAAWTIYFLSQETRRQFMDYVMRFT